MLTQHTIPNSGSQLGRAVLEPRKGFLNASFLSHKSILSQSSLQFSTQPCLLASAAKSFAMESIGDLTKAFRAQRGWSYTRMAKEVSKHTDRPVSRQAITQLEQVGERKPHYIAALAKVMGTTTDWLLSGKTNQTEFSTVDVVSVSSSPAKLAADMRNLPPQAREQAASLLQNLARDPDGPWANYLTDFLRNTLVTTEKPEKPERSVGVNLAYAEKAIPHSRMYNLGDTDAGQVVKPKNESDKPKRVPKPGNR